MTTLCPLAALLLLHGGDLLRSRPLLRRQTPTPHSPFPACRRLRRPVHRRRKDPALRAAARRHCHGDKYPHRRQIRTATDAGAVFASHPGERPLCAAGGVRRLRPRRQGSPAERRIPSGHRRLQAPPRLPAGDARSRRRPGRRQQRSPSGPRRAGGPRQYRAEARRTSACSPAASAPSPPAPTPATPAPPCRPPPPTATSAASPSPSPDRAGPPTPSPASIWTKCAKALKTCSRIGLSRRFPVATAAAAGVAAAAGAARPRGWWRSRWLRRPRHQLPPHEPQRPPRRLLLERRQQRARCQRFRHPRPAGRPALLQHQSLRPHYRRLPLHPAPDHARHQDFVFLTLAASAPPRPSTNTAPSRTPSSAPAISPGSPRPAACPSPSTTPPPACPSPTTPSPRHQPPGAALLNYIPLPNLPAHSFPTKLPAAHHRRKQPPPSACAMSVPSAAAPPSLP